MNKPDSIQEIGRNKLYQYEMSGGLLDIGIGIFLIAFSFFIQMQWKGFWEIGYPLFVFVLYAAVRFLWKLIVIPRLGYAHFTDQIKKYNRDLLNYLGIFLIFPLYALVISIEPDPGTVTDITWMITLFLILWGILDKVRFYFIITLIISQLLNPIYRAPYWQIILYALIMTFLTSKAFQKWATSQRKKPQWKSSGIPKPENFLQFVLVVLIAAAFQYFLYIFFRPDVTTFIKNGVVHNPALSVGLVSAIWLIFLGIAYKTSRMYLYAALVAIMASLSYLTAGMLSFKGIYLFVPGCVIFISGLMILIRFIKDNPRLNSNNFQEEGSDEAR